MPQYIEYPLSDGTTVLIEVESHGKVVPASNDANRKHQQSKMGFKQAFSNIKSSIKDVISEFDDLHVEEAEIKFGLKSVGEAGIFAISKVGAEVNYEITLKWKKNEKDSSVNKKK